MKCSMFYKSYYLFVRVILNLRVRILKKERSIQSTETGKTYHTPEVLFILRSGTSKSKQLE